MKSKAKNYIMCGLAVLVILLASTVRNDSAILDAARRQLTRLEGLADLDDPNSYHFWKFRIFIAAYNRGETTEQTSPDGDSFYVLTHAKDDLPSYISDKSVID